MQYSKRESCPKRTHIPSELWYSSTMLMVPSTGTTPICSDCNVGWIRIRNPALGLAMNFLKEKTKMPCTFYFLNQKFDSDSIWIRFELDSNYILPKPVHRMVWMIFLVSTLLMRRSNTMRRISNFHFVRFRHFTAIWELRNTLKIWKFLKYFAGTFTSSINLWFLKSANMQCSAW